MLREYQLENFKAFAGPETIPIRPITLIYGPNSSGKSSILQSLLLLKQTLEDEDNSTSLLLKGKLVDLGNYKEFIHRHDVSRSFSFKALFNFDFVTDDSKKNLPSWLQEVWARLSPMGLQVRFACEEETQSANFFQVDIFVGDESSPLISYIPLRCPGEQTMTLTKIHARHNYWRAWWMGMKRYIKQELKRGEVESVLHNGVEYASLRHFLDYLEDYPLEKALEDLQEENLQSFIDYQTFLPVSEGESWLDIHRELERTSRYIEQLERFIKKVGSPAAGSSEFAHELQERLLKQREKLFKRLERKNRSNQNSSSTDRQEEPSAEDSSPFAAELLYSSSYAIGLKQELPWERLNVFPLTSYFCPVFRHLVKEMIYLGPLRSYPERYYTLSNNLSEHVGPSGEMLPDVLFRNPEIVKRVNAEFDRFQLGYELKLSVLRDENSDLSDVFALRIVDKKTGVSASLRDVGFGVSQVLPIIVQSLLSRNKTLLIEQPEIHLHPALQAELGDLFIQSALNEPPVVLSEKQNTFIVETHSEHLLLRIMRRMRETFQGNLPEGLPPVRPEDVAVLYVERDGQQSIVREMPLNERGELVKAWPGGFFEEGLREVLS